jgi:hypothetical protein
MALSEHEYQPKPDAQSLLWMTKKSQCSLLHIPLH